MENTKLIKLLKTFSKAEILKFRDYINSPYYNKNPNVSLLGEEVLNFFPEFGYAEFTIEKIYERVSKCSCD